MAYTKAHTSTRTGALKLAQQRYRQTHKDKLNEKKRQTYDPVKRRQAYDSVKRRQAYQNNKAKKLLTPLELKEKI
jgi:hypothetical protein